METHLREFRDQEEPKNGYQQPGGPVRTPLPTRLHASEPLLPVERAVVTHGPSGVESGRGGGGPILIGCRRCSGGAVGRPVPLGHWNAGRAAVQVVAVLQTGRAFLGLVEGADQAA